MNPTSKKIKILAIKPTHVDFRLIDEGLKIKMGKQFFNKRVKMGIYNMVKKDAINPCI